LGCQMIRRQERFAWELLEEAYMKMQTLIREASLC